MTTRTYSDLLSLIEALCGVTFATNETARIRALVNRRAKRAYRATDLWPRFLVHGEERTVTNSVVPYDEDSLDSIDTYLAIRQYSPATFPSGPEYLFSVGSTGALLEVGDSAPTSAFVTYKARNDDVYGTTGSDTTTVPDEWVEYIAHSVYADFLRSEGQQEKAALADAEANEILTDELLRIDTTMTTNVIANRVSTNLNMQYRS